MKGREDGSSSRGFFLASPTSRRIMSKKEDPATVGKVTSKMGNLQLLTRPRGPDEETKQQLSPMQRDASTSDYLAPRTPDILKHDKEMGSAKPMLGDFMKIEDLYEFLTDNPNFDVIGAIGPQGAGKSTILSMLAGNEPEDMYRYYVFRPCSREAIESSRYQTIKLFMYVGKSRVIYIDCQPSSCGSILDENLRRSWGSKPEEKSDVHYSLESLELIAFVLQICQTVLVCSDWVLDIELIKQIRLAESLKASLNMDIFNIPRRTNLLFLHTRAKAADFSKLMVKQRSELIRRMFNNSRRIRIPEDPFPALIPIAELKPRKDTLTGSQAAAASERLYDSQEMVSFNKSMDFLKKTLANLPRERFSLHNFTEKQWFQMAQSIWRDPSFVAALNNLRDTNYAFI